MSDRRRWLIGCAGAALIGCGLLAGGCAGTADLTPRQAFALTASALSGEDRYAFTGELTSFGPDGQAERRTRYHGQVEGHRPSALEWDGEAAAQDADGSHPLALAAALQASSSAIEYAPGGSPARLRITLDPEVARLRIEQSLRRQLADAQREVDGLPPSARSSARAQAARAKLAQAAALLDRTLPSLRVTTVCEWSASRRTWFPNELREETTLAYRLNGRDTVEKRTSVTNFRKQATVVQ